MQWIIANSCRATLLMFLLASAAIAGPLPTDPAAMTGWKGTQAFVSPMPATVDYAVYALGQFSASAALHHPVDPSGGQDWVYAYEIFAGSTTVLTLTVGIQPGAVPQSYVGTNRISDWSFSPELGGPPDTGLSKVFYNWDSDLLAVSNVRWTNSPNGSNPVLWKNTHSDILYFTAPFAPQWFNSSLSGGGSNINEQNLPSPNPVPEPGTAVLAAIAGAFLLAIQWRRRRSASR